MKLKRRRNHSREQEAMAGNDWMSPLRMKWAAEAPIIMEGGDGMGEEAPAPNYKLAADPRRSCDTCAFNNNPTSGDYCTKYNFAVDPTYTCNSWHEKELGLDKLKYAAAPTAIPQLRPLPMVPRQPGVINPQQQLQAQKSVRKPSVVAQLLREKGDPTAAIHDMFNPPTPPQYFPAGKNPAKMAVFPSILGTIGGDPSKDITYDRLVDFAAPDIKQDRARELGIYLATKGREAKDPYSLATRPQTQAPAIGTETPDRKEEEEMKKVSNLMMGYGGAGLTAPTPASTAMPTTGPMSMTMPASSAGSISSMTSALPPAPALNLPKMAAFPGGMNVHKAFAAVLGAKCAADAVRGAPSSDAKRGPPLRGGAPSFTPQRPPILGAEDNPYGAAPLATGMRGSEANVPIVPPSPGPVGAPATEGILSHIWGQAVKPSPLSPRVVPGTRPDAYSATTGGFGGIGRPPGYLAGAAGQASALLRNQYDAYKRQFAAQQAATLGQQTAAGAQSRVPQPQRTFGSTVRELLPNLPGFSLGKTSSAKEAADPRHNWLNLMQFTQDKLMGTPADVHGLAEQIGRNPLMPGRGPWSSMYTMPLGMIWQGPQPKSPPLSPPGSSSLPMPNTPAIPGAAGVRKVAKQNKTSSIRKNSKKIAKAGKDMPSFTAQDRPEKTKDIYRALKREHPGMPAEMKARIAAKQGKSGKQKQGPPYEAPLSKGGAVKQSRDERGEQTLRTRAGDVTGEVTFSPEDMDYLAKALRRMAMLGTGLGTTAGGAGLGALLGAAAGSARGNLPEGLGRGAIRGGLSGAGAGLGGLLGSELGGVAGAPGLGALAGLGAGGVGGYMLGGKLLGEPGGERKKKKEEEAKEASSRRVRKVARRKHGADTPITGEQPFTGTLPYAHQLQERDPVTGRPGALLPPGVYSTPPRTPAQRATGAPFNTDSDAPALAQPVPQLPPAVQRQPQPPMQQTVPPPAPQVRPRPQPVITPPPAGYQRQMQQWQQRTYKPVMPK